MIEISTFKFFEFNKSIQMFLTKNIVPGGSGISF